MKMINGWRVGRSTFWTSPPFFFLELHFRGQQQMEPIEAIIEGHPDYPIEVKMLGPRLGRVLRDCYLNPLSPNSIPVPIIKNDIVRLSHAPKEGKAAPAITKILYKAGPRFLSRIECPTAEQRYRMIAIGAVLGAVIEQWGRTVDLFHAEEIDMPALANAAGLTRCRVGLRRPSIHLCKIPFHTKRQELRGCNRVSGSC
jgi:hypothetical protein